MFYERKRQRAKARAEAEKKKMLDQQAKQRTLVPTRFIQFCACGTAGDGTQTHHDDAVSSLSGMDIVDKEIQRLHEARMQAQKLLQKSELQLQLLQLEKTYIAKEKTNAGECSNSILAPGVRGASGTVDPREQGGMPPHLHHFAPPIPANDSHAPTTVSKRLFELERQMLQKPEPSSHYQNLRQQSWLERPSPSRGAWMPPKSGHLGQSNSLVEVGGMTKTGSVMVSPRGSLLGGGGGGTTSHTHSFAAASSVAASAEIGTIVLQDEQTSHILTPPIWSPSQHLLLQHQEQLFKELRRPMEESVELLKAPSIVVEDVGTVEGVSVLVIDETVIEMALDEIGFDDDMLLATCGRSENLDAIQEATDAETGDKPQIAGNVPLESDPVHDNEVAATHSNLQSIYPPLADLDSNTVEESLTSWKRDDSLLSPRNSPEKEKGNEKGETMDNEPDTLVSPREVPAGSRFNSQELELNINYNDEDVCIATPPPSPREISVASKQETTEMAMQHIESQPVQQDEVAPTQLAPISQPSTSQHEPEEDIPMVKGFSFHSLLSASKMVIAGEPVSSLAEKKVEGKDDTETPGKSSLLSLTRRSPCGPWLPSLSPTKTPTGTYHFTARRPLKSQVRSPEVRDEEANHAKPIDTPSNADGIVETRSKIDSTMLTASQLNLASPEKHCGDDHNSTEGQNTASEQEPRSSLAQPKKLGSTSTSENPQNAACTVLGGDVASKTASFHPGVVEDPNAGEWENDDDKKDQDGIQENVHIVGNQNISLELIDTKRGSTTESCRSEAAKQSEHLSAENQSLRTMPKVQSHALAQDDELTRRQPHQVESESTLCGVATETGNIVQKTFVESKDLTKHLCLSPRNRGTRPKPEELQSPKSRVSLPSKDVVAVPQVISSNEVVSTSTKTNTDSLGLQRNKQVSGQPSASRRPRYKLKLDANQMKGRNKKDTHSGTGAPSPQRISTELSPHAITSPPKRSLCIEAQSEALVPAVVDDEKCHSSMSQRESPASQKTSGSKVRHSESERRRPREPVPKKSMNPKEREFNKLKHLLDRIDFHQHQLNNSQHNQHHQLPIATGPGTPNSADAVTGLVVAFGAPKSQAGRSRSDPYRHSDPPSAVELRDPPPPPRDTAERVPKVDRLEIVRQLTDAKSPSSKGSSQPGQRDRSRGGRTYSVSSRELETAPRRSTTTTTTKRQKDVRAPSPPPAFEPTAPQSPPRPKRGWPRHSVPTDASPERGGRYRSPPKDASPMRLRPRQPEAMAASGRTRTTEEDWDLLLQVRAAVGKRNAPVFASTSSGSASGQVLWPPPPPAAASSSSSHPVAHQR